MTNENELFPAAMVAPPPVQSPETHGDSDDDVAVLYSAWKEFVRSIFSEWAQEQDAGITLPPELNG